MKKLLSPAVFLLGVFHTFAASAAYVGMATPWETDLQPPVTPVMDRLYAIHNYLLLPIITAVAVFVLLLLFYICLRYNKKRHPVPSKTTHNTRLEIIWTVIPILILVVIAIPSLRIHYYMQRIVNPDLTVKVTGYQWYWHYDYPDNGGFGYDSYILKGKDLKPGAIRQLSVDHPMVVPVNTKVRVLITGADVIHSWSVPSFGVKRDAVPGRLNDTWFEADRTGTFYGQCSQLCGVGHGFMPIEVKVVTRDDYNEWVKQQQKKAGITVAPAAAAAPAEETKKPEPVAKPEEPKPGAAEKPAAEPAAAPAAVPAAEPAPEPEAKPVVIEETPEPAKPKPAAKPHKPVAKKTVRHAVATKKSEKPTVTKSDDSGSSDENDPAQYPDFKIRR